MKNFRGFTLIETMIAVTILSFSIAGPLFTASRTMVATEISRDQLTASYLAQEVIEYARALRDGEYLKLYPTQEWGSTVAWDNFKASPLITSCSSNKCALGQAKGDGTLLVTSCSSGTCPEAVPYNLNAPDPGTLFTSTFQATAVPPNEEKIVSTVSWWFHDTQHTITITDHLTPWQ